MSNMTVNTLRPETKRMIELVWPSSNHLRLFLDITGQYKVNIRGERSSDRHSDVLYRNNNNNTSLTPIVRCKKLFSSISYQTLRRTYVGLVPPPLPHNRPKISRHHGVVRKLPLASPISLRRPNQAHRHHPHTMGDYPCTWFGRRTLFAFGVQYRTTQQKVLDLSTL